MRISLVAVLTLVVLMGAGCVNVDLGQASKDWSEVGKSFADSYKEGGKLPAGGQTPPQAPTGR
jgi:hypothetical protein